MAARLLVLAPTCGGKSTLMRYLREHSDIEIAESDEAITEANGGVWPEDRLKDDVLIPQTTEMILQKERVIYLASYIPIELVRKARKRGFRTILLGIPPHELLRRNEQRMREEGYDDNSRWVSEQLEYYAFLEKQSLLDETLDGTNSVSALASELINRIAA